MNLNPHISAHRETALLCPQLRPSVQKFPTSCSLTSTHPDQPPNANLGHKTSTTPRGSPGTNCQPGTIGKARKNNIADDTTSEQTTERSAIPLIRHGGSHIFTRLLIDLRKLCPFVIKITYPGIQIRSSHFLLLPFLSNYENMLFEINQSIKCHHLKYHHDCPIAVISVPPAAWLG